MTEKDKKEVKKIEEKVEKKKEEIGKAELKEKKIEKKEDKTKQIEDEKLDKENKIEKGSQLMVEERKIVVPGELLAKGIDFLPGHGSYKEDGEIRSKIMGLAKIKEHLISVVPLSGAYIPLTGDGVIGIVENVQISSWLININSPYIGFLPLSEGTEEFVDLQRSDITDYFDVGDVIYARVNRVTKRKDTQLTMKDRMCRKLHGGNMLRITPAKVPRLIGRSGSMIEMIKKKTECHIIVGQNGYVWIKGEKESLAAEAVLTVEKESHIEGLTDRIEKMLDERSKEVVK